MLSYFKKGISIRGLVAYGIYCLENAILHFNEQNKEGWKLLLKKFWMFTFLPDNSALAGETWPEINVLEDLYCFAEECAYYKVISEAEGKNSPSQRGIQTFTQNELFYDAYKSNEIISIKILSAVISIITAEWNGQGHRYPTHDNIEEVKELVALMNKNKISLPDIENFRKYIWIQNVSKEKFYPSGAECGEPFFGAKELSKILK